MVGSIGEVVAAEALGLTLYVMSKPGHDEFDANGDVQIKMTAGNSVSVYDACDRLESGVKRSVPGGAFVGSRREEELPSE